MFYWESMEHPNFKLNEHTGMITMKHGTRDGKYHLRFKVFDRKHTQTDVPANVTVTVREIPHEAVINSGSIRISGISDEDFIRVWDYRVRTFHICCMLSFKKFEFALNNLFFFFHFQTQGVMRSKADKFREKLADLLHIDRENVDVFSVQLRRRNPPLTDIRFSAHGSPYYKPVRLNGLVLMKREEVCTFREN